MKTPIIAHPSKPKFPQYGNMYKDVEESNSFKIYDGKKWISFEPFEMKKEWDGFVDDETGIINGLPTVILKKGAGVNTFQQASGGGQNQSSHTPVSNTGNEGAATYNTDSTHLYVSGSKISGKTKIKHVYCPKNADLIVHDVADNKVDDLCGELTHEKYASLIIRCDDNTKFDGIKNLMGKLDELGAPIEQLTSLASVKEVLSNKE